MAATQGTDPQAAFQQLRVRARATSRKLAEVAQEVVQDAQRQRLAALALDDARVREAEARVREAEARVREAEARSQAADERDRAADDRDRIADERDRVADERDRLGDPPG
jgi:sulfite oxidase